MIFFLNIFFPEILLNPCLLYTSNCPYCKRALAWIDELKRENSVYEKISIELIDEQLNSELADCYDYYYVPALFDNNVKLHEGVITKEGLKSIFDSYLERCV